MMPAQVSTLSSSAQNTVSLVLLQISSRGFTFIVNQILLRYLSPTLLGISQQLELFTISILYFSRESLRVALQRQSIEKQQNSAKTNQRTRHKSFDPLSNRLQEVINLSYLPILLGPILATFFAWLYLSKASSESLAISYVRPSLFLFGIAAVIELSVEPCFAFAAHRQLIGLRAAAETVATLSRSIVTVSTAVWASRSSSALGALPFAFGQCAYALGLWVVYYGYDLKGSGARVSLLPTTIGSKSMYILSLFPKETLALASNLYAQSGLKHVLTQGDALLITLFADLPSQGIFALASNYGSLLARILFQPIEESSRSLLGRTLSVSPSKSSQAPSKENMRLVHTYLTTLLRFYSHLALLLLILAPPLSAPALSLLAGQIWRSSAAPRILSKYCRYLPLLAYNGLLEAFVSATASPAELRKQSIAMLLFSVVFAAAGYVLLGILGRGVDGILEANMCNMAIRIIWSRQWVEKWWTAARRAHKTDEKDALEVPVLRIFCAQTLPHPLTLAFAAGTWAVILQYPSAPDTWLRNSIGLQKSGGILDTLLDVAIIAVMGMPMLASITWSEWDTFVEPVINRFRSLVGIRYGGRAVEKEKKKTI